MDMEQRIFELLGDGWMTGQQLAAVITREYDGVSEDEAIAAAVKVIRERGTPRLAEAREALDRVAAAIPYI